MLHYLGKDTPLTVTPQTLPKRENDNVSPILNQQVCENKLTSTGVCKQTDSSEIYGGSHEEKATTTVRKVLRGNVGCVF